MNLNFQDHNYSSSFLVNYYYMIKESSSSNLSNSLSSDLSDSYRKNILNKCINSLQEQYNKENVFSWPYKAVPYFSLYEMPHLFHNDLNKIMKLQSTLPNLNIDTIQKYLSSSSNADLLKSLGWHPDFSYDSYNIENAKMRINDIYNHIMKECYFIDSTLDANIDGILLYNALQEFALDNIISSYYDESLIPIPLNIIINENLDYRIIKYDITKNNNPMQYYDDNDKISGENVKIYQVFVPRMDEDYQYLSDSDNTEYKNIIKIYPYKLPQNLLAADIIACIKNCIENDIKDKLLTPQTIISPMRCITKIVYNGEISNDINQFNNILKLVNTFGKICFIKQQELPILHIDYNSPIPPKSVHSGINKCYLESNLSEGDYFHG